MDLHFERRLGEDIAPLLPDIVALRRQLLRDWPVLEAGEQARRRDTLSASFGSPRAVAVLAWQGARLAGAATGLPMADEVAELQQPLAAAGSDPRTVFFLDYVLLLPEFRGHGAGSRLFAEREDHARALGYRWAAVAEIQRSPADPRRPAAWVPLDGYWRRRGYAPTEMVARLAWKEVGEGVETAKPVRLWRKSLAADTP